jgi:carboxypeptidase Q
MRRSCCLFVFLCVFMNSLLWAQEETVDTAMMNRIREEGLNHSQVMFIAHYITDVSGSRLTNSDGFRRAAGWIISTLKDWGLVNVKLEPWGEFGYGWDLERSYIAMSAPYYSSIIAYPAPFSGSTRGPISASVILVEKADSAYIVQNADKFKGHILLLKTLDTLIEPDFKPDASRYSDSSLANMQDEYMFSSAMLKMYMPVIAKSNGLRKIIQQAGGVALLEMSRGARDGTVFVDGLGGDRKPDLPVLPHLLVSKEDYLRMERLLETGIEVKMELDIRARFEKSDLQGHNVVAEIPGTDPSLKNQVVMLGGHLDSWQSATGATDNGAGCIAAMEAVRILKTLGLKPRRTIRIALWDGEEEGLFGSFHYVKNHFGDPVDMQLKPDQAKVSAYFNLDI